MTFGHSIRTAAMPIWAAMAVAVAVAGPVLGVAAPALAQTVGNAQADQSSSLRNRIITRNLPPTGLYASEAGERFVLDISGSRPMVRFDRANETWVLRATPAPRGDIIYRNDAGDQVLRVTADGGMTVFTSRTPGGSPVSLSGPGRSLIAPTLGPAQLFNLMARRSAMVSQSLGRLVEINIDTGTESEALTVEALLASTDAVMRIARSSTARDRLSGLRRITIVEGARAAVGYSRGELRIVVAPRQGVAGRPSSARVIRVFTQPN